MKEQLKQALIELDKNLTSNALTRVIHAANDSNLSSFIEGYEYYLSDGGYSRIIMNKYFMELRLTSNSRKEVKAVWDNCKQQREAVEQLYVKSQQ